MATATAAPTITWQGASGTNYVYSIYPIGTDFTSGPGNYMFARESSQGWYAVYAGETADLSERFSNHHKMPCIKMKGATHIHVHGSSTNAQTRRNEESDIIAKWKPSCNG